MKKNIFLCLFIFACSSTSDPLKNSKELIKKGHADLYNNGAFKVPGTTITLIPKGPTPTELGLQMIGPKAKLSFKNAVEDAKQSFVVVGKGTKATFQLSGAINQKSKLIATKIKSELKTAATYIMSKTDAASTNILASNWDSANNVYQTLKNKADSLSKQHLDSAKDDRASLSSTATKIEQDMVAGAKNLQHKSLKSGKEGLEKSYQDFVLGYVTLPQKLKRNLNVMEFKESFEDFSRRFEKINSTRIFFSKPMEQGLTETVQQTSKDVNDSLSEAGKSFDNSSALGYSLSALKAVGYLIDGILIQGMVKPVFKGLTYSTGYVIVNGVAFPAMLVGQSLLSTGDVAVKIVWNSARSIYDITAPTGIAALSGAMQLLVISGGHLSAGAVYGSAKLTRHSIEGVNQITYAGRKSYAYVEKGSIKYIAAPIAYASSLTVGATTGVGILAAGKAAAVTLKGAAASSPAVTRGTGYAVSGTTAITGTLMSVAVGSGLFIYQVGKGIVVPTSHVLGGGIVLTAGNLIHLGAHSLLAVADATYLVLSLEGPKAIVYAIKMPFTSDEDYEAGTVLDLEQLRQQGAEIKQLPLSEHEIEAVLNSLE